MKDYHAELAELIEMVVREGASDLHLASERHPTMRVSGNLIPLVKKPELAKEDTLGLLGAMVSSEMKQRLLEKQELDFSFEYKKTTRFRGNAFFQKGAVGVALRVIPHEIKSIAELRLPKIIESFARRKQGFFLVVGPVGQGKSTTLASMIDLINKERAEHIVTIEDPVEYLFQEERSMIEQREVGIDTKDFHTALLSAFRQDVDVIMIGEMRGPETMSAAVTAAETGHLVLSTLHTNNAAQTVDRIIDSFPAEQQAQIRVQLSGSLIAIFSQRLVPKVGGGLVPAYELLINNNAVGSLIREGRTHELNLVIETGLEHGMIDMNRSLTELVRRGEITVENAFLHSFNPKGLEKLL
ncbi:MAG: type IV pili twitching motility protein PilT [Candidatus Yonathbacteria bacterium RIFCSPHIGHO2_01_FULL_51_10]|uniref:Type IV pili twitching motility protein PilT n=1 Tax=Candidatus Yonathbacteria bacterium RIFCSPHIGHO2_01_FULL_51_10 TaxID=1802723 RepID=A0A1G2S3P0_9BACT|nr:MAG: type IV pili twitching motility protein PilT [Candidatus Yonathbacteria bacterium RIFCSPHIGHO2_01_FULL_51_10]